MIGLKNAVWANYVDIENMLINQNITYEDKTGKEKIYIKKGTKVETGKCDMPYFLESEIERMLVDEIGLIKFNKKNWEKMKENLFKDRLILLPNLFCNDRLEPFSFILIDFRLTIIYSWKAVIKFTIIEAVFD